MTNCYYCKNIEADNDQFWYRHEMFFIAKRIFTGGMKYKSEVVAIPRCKSCKKTHNKLSLTTFIGGFILFAISFLLLYKYSDSDLYMIGFMSLIISAIIAGGANLVYLDFFTDKSTSIIAEEDILDFPKVSIMIKEGWVLHKPDSSIPMTASENIEFEKYTKHQINKTDNKL